MRRENYFQKENGKSDCHPVIESCNFCKLRLAAQETWRIYTFDPKLFRIIYFNYFFADDNYLFLKKKDDF